MDFSRGVTCNTGTSEILKQHWSGLSLPQVGLNKQYIHTNKPAGYGIIV